MALVTRDSMIGVAQVAAPREGRAMNGVHDMGGMHGLGPLVREMDEPVWHAPWEARVFALSSGMGAWRRGNIDSGRQRLERMPARGLFARELLRKMAVYAV